MKPSTESTSLIWLSGRRALPMQRPTPALQPWVECYWALSGEWRETAEEKLYPDGGVTLLFDFDAGASAVIIDISTTLRRARLNGRVDRVGVRFLPGGVWALLGVAPLDLMPAEVDISRWALPGLARLLAELKQAIPAQRMVLIERWLLALAARGQPRIGAVQRLLPHLLDGRQAIERAIQRQGLSRRTLERRLQGEVGLAPAQLARLYQLKRARTLLGAGDSTISAVAADCGFYDQAHFTHHFRAYVEETPAAYRQRKQAGRSPARN